MGGVGGDVIDRMNEMTARDAPSIFAWQHFRAHFRLGAELRGRRFSHKRLEDPHPHMCAGTRDLSPIGHPPTALPPQSPQTTQTSAPVTTLQNRHCDRRCRLYSLSSLIVVFNCRL